VAHVRRTKRANQDLFAIWRYIAADNPDAASAQLMEIDRKFTLLSFFPQIGQKRDDLRKGLRIFPCGAYLILY
jgi:toxin ParE1/3/4